MYLNEDENKSREIDIVAHKEVFALLVYSTHFIYEMQLLTDVPQCSPIPTPSTCADSPLFAIYQSKTKVFNEYQSETQTLHCLAVEGTPYPVNNPEQPLVLLRNQALINLDLNYFQILLLRQ